MLGIWFTFYDCWLVVEAKCILFINLRKLKTSLPRSPILCFINCFVIFFCLVSPWIWNKVSHWGIHRSFAFRVTDRPSRHRPIYIPKTKPALKLLPHIAVLKLPFKFFRIEFYRIYRIYKICRKLFLLFGKWEWKCLKIVFYKSYRFCRFYRIQFICNSFLFFEILGLIYFLFANKVGES